MTDDYGRPALIPEVKGQIAQALAAIPEGKRGALLVIADERGARAHLAAQLNGTWKVAAGGGWQWGKGGTAYVAIVGEW